MKLVDDVRQISAITYGFMASKALFAALEVDLFSEISRGRTTLAALSAAVGIAENRLRSLLTALKTLGLVSERAGSFANAPATQTYLVDGAPGDFREYIRYVNGRFGYEGFRHLDKALRGERIFEGQGFYEGLAYSDPMGGERFSAAQHTGSLGPARLMAKRVDLAGCKRLLDVGGGSGAYTLAFCAKNPDLRAIIFDFAATVATAKQNAAAAGMSDRIAHLAGNAITEPWPPGQDVVLISYVWSAVGRDDIAILAERAHAALDNGGLVLVHDFMVDDDNNGPPFAAWYLLSSVLDNPSAVCLTPGFVETALRDAGFRIDKTEVMLDGITMLTRARKQ